MQRMTSAAVGAALGLLLSAALHAPPPKGTVSTAVHSIVPDARNEAEGYKAGVLSLKVLKANDWGRRTVYGSATVLGPGVAVTCHHVVAGAAKVTATTASGDTVTARVTSEHPELDLAVLAFVADCRPLRLGGPPHPGDTVLAVGNPFGEYPDSLTRGVVSALGREITMPSNEVLKGLVQHDAAINPGNSGGPLLSIDGEVVGVNVALRDGARGIAFAIPALTIKSVLPR